MSKMKILEHFLCGKHNVPNLCEDGLVIGQQLIAVIDGVTAKGTYSWDGMTSGYYAKQLLVDYLQKDIATQTSEELFDNLDLFLNANIQKHLERLTCADYPRASIIIYNNYYKEIWSYGDCQCRINNTVHKHTKKIDKLNAKIRALNIEYHLSQGKTLEELKENDLGRNSIQQNLILQFAFENKLGYWGYPVLNGMGVEKSMIKRYPVSKGDMITLASDGYPVLKENLNQCEKSLENILKNDPLCFHLHPSTKGLQKGNVSFDDRAYCRFIP